jgi:hypothetical protein
LILAPADRDQADPVRADLGWPEHPAGLQAPEIAFAEIVVILLDVECAT